jgi:hypothetical protein
MAPGLMKIQLHINPAGSGALVAMLVERLGGLGAVPPTISVGTSTPLPVGVRLLLDIERRFHRLPPEPGPALADGETGPSSRIRCDLRVDLSADAPTNDPAVRSLRVHYDGHAGEDRLYAALLASRLPRIEIVDGNGHVAAVGTPCTDNAETLLQAAQCVHARVATLLVMAITRPLPITTATPVCSSQPLSSPIAVTYQLGLMRLVSLGLRNLAHATVRRLYHLCCYAPHWRIGWRFIDGPGVAERGNLGGVPWRVLPDPGDRFYADPMPISVDGRSYIFFEDFPHRTQKGMISYVEVTPDGPVGPVRLALEEPWHLSYPFLVQDQGQIYMVPESSQNREVVLYRAEAFPDRWVRHATLLSDIDLSDATIFEDGGRFWMFGCTNDGGGSPSDTLSIFWADKLAGPWLPHQQNPVLIDPVSARPAGPLQRIDGRLWRVTQDCSGGYGRAVGLVEIGQLTTERFEQKLVAVIRPDAAWSGRRFHTLARAGRLECIDGSASAPKSRLLSQLFFPDRNGRATARRQQKCEGAT